MKLTHVRLLVDDVRACVDFYRDVLGFEVTADHDVYVELGTGDVALSLFARAGQAETVQLQEQEPGDGVLLGLSVDSVDAEIERLGERIVAGPVDRHDWGIRVAYLRDPAGNLIELYEPIPMSE
ncbi:MAG TPA: VOC family protein [Gaiellaceae bacterium]|nr:VOC family protein [Gaiellaceae bacterium]